MGLERFRLVFRMELATDEPGMRLARQLDDLHELSVSRNAAEHQTFLLEPLAVIGIELVTVTFTDLVSAAVNLLGQRAWRQTASPRAETHRTAEFFYVHQIAQFKNDRMRCFEIKLGRVRIFQLARVARKLDTRGLHAEADTEIWRTRLAGVVNRANHAGDAAFGESAGNEARIAIAQAILIVVVVHQFFRLDPLHDNAKIVRHAPVRQRFTQRLVRVFKLDVLAYDRDPGISTRRFADRRDEFAPFRKIHLLRVRFESQLRDDQVVESLLVKRKRHVVDRVYVLGADYGLLLYDTEQSDLPAQLTR